MKRSMTWLALLIAVPLAAHAEPGADGARYQEGVHYQRLPVPVETRDPSRVEVIEVFSYACIHCRNFQPVLDAWTEAAPPHVDFHRLPATFDPTWARLAQAYYAAEALGVTGKVHELIFSGIHDRGVNLSDPSRLRDLFEEAAGVAPEQFDQVFNSFSVRSRVQQADARVRAYRVSGTPTVIVDGRFRVDASMAGNHAAMLAVVDELVRQQQASRVAMPGPAAGGREP
jgi:protein dithiol oxidoreductase (disulfide-forming)